jgi:DNA-binding beta-propeller fold protein YncE
MKKNLIPALAATLIATFGVVIGNAQITPSSLGNQSFSSVIRLTQSGDYSAPRDAAPDGNGETIYFLANGKTGPGVFKVSAHGGRALEFKLGEPFVNPRGLALSSDGKWIFVADPEAGNGGEVLKLSVEIGSIECTILTRTANKQAQGGTHEPP